MYQTRTYRRWLAGPMIGTTLALAFDVTRMSSVATAFGTRRQRNRDIELMV